MKIIKVGLTLALTISLVYFLNTSHNFGSPIPPLGKFLSPFQGFWQNAQTANQNSETLSIPCLKDKVTIVYDSVLIPHIYANNDEDLFVAQGFITAKNRLWQMEFQTHAAAGRVSEIIGKAALDFDRTQRRLGMGFAAEVSVKSMESNPTAKLMVDSYTAGINAYIQSLDESSLPIEYKLLGYEPEPWTNLKSAYLLKYMAKTLNTGERDLEMTNALKLFGKETIELLFPDNEGVADPIVDKTNQWNFKPMTLDSVELSVPAQLVHVKPFEKSPPDVGSNNWAVSGTKTATGSPILCNDPHLELNLPSIWYIVHLSAPGINSMGASLPGAPSIISGFNDSIAWGVTNAQRDLVDWFRIEFKDNSKKEYKLDGNWVAAKKRVEEIKVKGEPVYYDTVTYTHQGPVVYDSSFHGAYEKSHFAYRWIAHDPSEEVMTFYKLNRSKNHADYMEALNHYSSPAQNFVFACVNGDIAMRIQGKYPIRRKNEGKFILDGTKSSSDWQAFIPNDQNVMDKNPVRGFVSSANQFPADASYPYYVQASNWEAYRNRRINQVLTELTKCTPQDLMNLQLDNFNLKASESLPTFLLNLDSASLSGEALEAYKILKAWDYKNEIDSEGASYYEAWIRAFVPMVWDEFEDQKVALPWPSTYLTIKLMKEQPELTFFDIKSTPEKETAKEVIRKSFEEAVTVIEKWKSDQSQKILKENPLITTYNVIPRWASYKDAIVNHLLRQKAFSYNIEHGGNSSIVNAHSKTHGPSWRMVVSLEKNVINAWGVYPGGQSGNPGSPYYNNLLNLWTQGKYVKFTFTAESEKMKGKELATITLNPASK
ncbi:MAG: penicillin acylase family protein [Cyclobacteriaceae bacterium]|nr:penicillin acylase family protein [Cyclobacteriaceae bacterium]